MSKDFNEPTAIVVDAAAYAALRAENERLRGEVADLLPRMDADSMHISNLARENDRLRAALEQIEAGYGQHLSAAELASMARQAL